MPKTISKLLSLSLITSFLSAGPPAFAQDYFKASSDKERFSLKGNEFMSGQNYGDTLMRVSLLGAVGKAGSHVIPADSKLSSLLSFAGGPNDDAEIDSITVKRKSKSGYEVIEYDLEEFLQEPGKKDLALKPHDIIHVPPKNKFLSDNSLRALTVASTILGIIVSGIVIGDRL